jgi:hypothetical protein
VKQLLFRRAMWLRRLTRAMRPEFAKHGAPLPDRFKITCRLSPTHGRRTQNQTLGVCLEAAESSNGVVRIYISHEISDSLEAAEVLVHELVHAALGIKGHRQRFERLALAIGLIGPMNATRAGDTLREQLQTLIAKLGPYPSSTALDPTTQLRKRPR